MDTLPPYSSVRRFVRDCRNWSRRYPVARPRTFDDSEVLEGAVEIFREKGYGINLLTRLRDSGPRFGDAVSILLGLIDEAAARGAVSFPPG